MRFKASNVNSHNKADHNILSPGLKQKKSEINASIAHNATLTQAEVAYGLQPAAKRVKLVGSNPTGDKTVHACNPESLKASGSLLLNLFSGKGKSERWALQKAALMEFYAYEEQVISKKTFNSPGLRKVCTRGDPKFATMDSRDLEDWIDSETTLFLGYLTFDLARMREYHGGSPFMQAMFDGVTLNNSKGYSAHGCEYTSHHRPSEIQLAEAANKAIKSGKQVPLWDASTVLPVIANDPFSYAGKEELRNWNICIGFQRSSSKTAPHQAEIFRSSLRRIKCSQTDLRCSQEDFAELATAKLLGCEKEGCGMHNYDKVGSSAVGLLVRSEDTVEVNPFPAGKAAMAEAHKFATHFSRSRDKRLPIYHECCKRTGCPSLIPEVNQNGTRIAANHGELKPLIRTVPGNIEYSKLSLDNPQVSPETWQILAEFDSVLNSTALLTTAAQYEAAWTGAYRHIIRHKAESEFSDTKSSRVVNIWAPTPTKNPIYKMIAPDQLTTAGRECKRRALLEAKHRNTMVGGKLSMRDHIAILLDQRTLNSEVLSGDDKDFAKIMLENEYLIYCGKFLPPTGSERTKTAKPRNMLKTPPKGIGKSSDAWSDVDTSSDSEEEQDDRLKREFKETFKKWRKLDIDWHRWCPTLKEIQERRLGTADDGDDCGPMDALMSYIDLDLGPLYLDLIHTAEARKIGRLPQMAMTVLGNNLAASFCERVNSGANLILTHGRTLLEDDHLKKLCMLRVNRNYIGFMKENYPNLATHIMSEANKAMAPK